MLNLSALTGKKKPLNISSLMKPPIPEVGVMDVAHELPTGVKKTAKAIGKGVVGLGQATFRSFGAIGAKIAEGDIKAQFKPQGQFQQELYGTKDPVSFTSIGAEVTDIFGKKERPILNPILGGFIAFTDAFTGGKGKSTIKAISKTIAGLNDVESIVKQLKTVFKGSNKEIRTIADGLRTVTKADEVEKILMGSKINTSAVTSKKGTSIFKAKAPGQSFDEVRKPFSIQEQSRYNSYTHYPKDFNKEYENIVNPYFQKIDGVFGKDVPDELRVLLDEHSKKAKQFLRAEGDRMIKAPSPYVVGPANYNVSRAQKANSAFGKKANDFAEFERRLDSKINQLAKEKDRARFSALSESDQLKENIASVERQIARMNPTRDEFFIEKMTKQKLSLEKKLTKLQESESQTRTQLKTVNKKITQEIPATKSLLPREIPQKIVRPLGGLSISPEKSVFPRKSSFKDTIQIGDKKVKANTGIPEEKLKAMVEETQSIKDILNRSEMRIRATTAKGKPKTSRDLAQEITDNVKKQNETLKDSEIAQLREKNLLGAETIDEIILRKRGIITDKEAIERAKGMRGTIDDVLNLPKGAVPTKEQITAVSQIVQGEREFNLKLVQLIDDKGIAQTIDERALIAKLGKGFEGLDQHELLNRALAESTLKLKKAEIVLLGMRGEIGRSLQATKQVVEAVDSRMRIVFGKIKKLNATEQQAFLEKLAKEDIKDDKKFIRFLDELNTADFFDKFAEYSTAAKLWNPTTHAVNLGGNTIRQFVDIAITSIVNPRAARADIAGMRVGLKQGLKNSFRALTDDGYASQLSKYIEEGGTAPAIGGKLGQWVRTPFRMLGAGDEIFRAIGFQRSIYRQAYTLARKEGLRGKELEKRMEALLKNPTMDILENATEQAKRLTFQEDMGEITSKINDFRTPANFTSKTGKSISLLLRFFLPFLKTPTNLLKQAVDFSPLGGVKNFKKIKEAAKAGDTETVGRLIGESVVGSALTAYIIMETLDGNITGGAPRDKSGKDRFYREKKLPYAIKIDDTWYQYKRVDPFSTVLGLVSDATTLAGQEDISTASLVNTLINQMSDKTYLAGIGDFMNLVMGEPWERDYALKSMVLGASLPSFIGHTARSTDPIVRKTDTIVDRIKSQIPFVSKSLPVQVNVLGENIERANKGLNYFFNPIQSEIAEIDPITKHLMDIDKTIPIPQSYFSRDGVKYELDAETYSRYTKEVGTSLKDKIEILMRTSSYQQLSEDKKSDEIDKLRKDIADEWKDKYVGLRSPKKRGTKSLENIFITSQGKTLETIFK